MVAFEESVVHNPRRTEFNIIDLQKHCRNHLPPFSHNQKVYIATKYKYLGWLVFIF